MKVCGCEGIVQKGFVIGFLFGVCPYEYKNFVFYEQVGQIASYDGLLIPDVEIYTLVYFEAVFSEFGCKGIFVNLLKEAVSEGIPDLQRTGQYFLGDFSVLRKGH